MRRLCRFVQATALCLSLFFVTSCAACKPPVRADGITFTDAAGRTVKVPTQPQRVVALSGSFAEVWTLAGGMLCGVTDDVYEENRLDVEDVPIVGTIKHPDWERVLACAPDLVLLSADIAGHVAGDELLTAAGVPHMYCKVEKFDDYVKLLQICTQLTGRDDLYQTNGVAVAADVAAVVERVAARPPVRVLFLRAYATGVKAKADDHIVTFILRDFSCVNIAEGHAPLLGDATAELSQEIVLQADPDVILATSMGDEGAAKRTFDALLETPIYKSLAAVRTGRTHMLPKQLFHYKPNARWGEAYAYLEEILYS